MDHPHINPWLQLWIHPKKTIRALIDTQPRRYIYLFSILAGVLTGILFPLMFWQPQWSTLSKSIYILIGIISGGIFGLLSLFFESWLYRLTGSWIGGKGKFYELKCAVGWKNYPTILIIIFNGLSFLAANIWLKALLGLIYFILSVWGFTILANVVGEAHRFSAWKGLATVIIAIVLVFVFFFIISLLTPLLAPLFQ